MTSRYVVLGLLVAGILAPVTVACSAPTVEGSGLSNAEPSKKRDRESKTTKSSELSDDDEDPEVDAKTSAQTAPAKTTPAPTTTEPAPTTTATTTATTPPPPPPVTQPACGSANPIACLDCCLDNNLAAVPFENAYDDCINACEDSACDLKCQQQHVTACNGSAACKANHACMEANNCLAQNKCN